ncbi:hypothetical protein MTO96_016625 [Rhipicephalus appendiculatus]
MKKQAAQASVAHEMTAVWSAQCISGGAIASDSAISRLAASEGPLAAAATAALAAGTKGRAVSEKAAVTPAISGKKKKKDQAGSFCARNFQQNKACLKQLVFSLEPQACVRVMGRCIVIRVDQYRPTLPPEAD